mmetsp:Transcript_1440/g.2884  ORF Transcript_1440/g.2884 Transcript_1440/m.2884 type:complete len:308 (+) Transcript_1440:128-1051(+)|eukprot:CAMPEP_0118932452 /NCGR_PEP_ID=MMETSP1169-20130426/10272_1 /TAXON_ID=36882 /ORGANISM="Pyramimonas obovata, Strain CCMP722" /LENGTH=307 /DNA_ID=CAMNT_0006875115 /DNA_START=110 /DNA_END=1033 /DNA_ORIENTATION=+
MGRSQKFFGARLATAFSLSICLASVAWICFDIRHGAVSPTRAVDCTRKEDCTIHGKNRVSARNTDGRVHNEVLKYLDYPATTHAGRGDETKEGEGDEYTRLRKRNFAEYSEGHQRIYLAAIALIGGADTKREAVILEVGTGIGWGLKQILADVKVRAYVGVEPCVTCARYVQSEVILPWLTKERHAHSQLSPKKRAAAKLPNFTIFAEDFLHVSLPQMESALAGAPQADFTFCVEVAEHVQPADRLRFLKELRRWTANALFFSTPNKDSRPKDGALNSNQWKELLLEADFISVSILEWQWTVLFICT